MAIATSAGSNVEVNSVRNGSVAKGKAKHVSRAAKHEPKHEDVTRDAVGGPNLEVKPVGPIRGPPGVVTWAMAWENPPAWKIWLEACFSTAIKFSKPGPEAPWNVTAQGRPCEAKGNIPVEAGRENEVQHQVALQQGRGTSHTKA